jgi:hypothetical protein
LALTRICTRSSFQSFVQEWLTELQSLAFLRRASNL